jgi:hypothetical protein
MESTSKAKQSKAKQIPSEFLNVIIISTTQSDHPTNHVSPHKVEFGSCYGLKASQGQ